MKGSNKGLSSMFNVKPKVNVELLFLDKSILQFQLLKENICCQRQFG